MSQPKILQSRRWPEAAEQALNQSFDVTYDAADTPLNPDQIIAAMQSHDALALTVTDRLDRSMIETAMAGGGAKCQMIANFGVGVNHIDLDAAQEHNLLVSNTPGVLTDATADIAMTLMLMVMRRAGEGERELRGDAWSGWRPTHMLGRDFSGKTLGIIGMGRIGKAVARRCALGFGMNIVFYNRSEVSDCGDIGARQLPSVEDVCAVSDILSLHCPGGSETHHIMSHQAIAAMRPDAIVINTARGDVIDEDALATALINGRIGGAGLDVFQGEPDINPALKSAPNTVLLPHLGSATIETRNAMGMMVVENLKAHFTGQPLPNPVMPNRV